MKKVLVAGATGRSGKCVLTELKLRGYAVRAIARDPNKLAGLGVDETVTADLTKPETLRGVCDGVEFVFSCAGATMRLSDIGDRKSFYDVDNQGNRNLLVAAKTADIKKFVYVSLACADNRRQTEYADAHEKFVEALRASGCPIRSSARLDFSDFCWRFLNLPVTAAGFQSATAPADRIRFTRLTWRELASMRWNRISENCLLADRTC